MGVLYGVLDGKGGWMEREGGRQPVICEMRFLVTLIVPMVRVR